MPPAGSRAGFSLTEILTAVVILGLVVAPVFLAYTTSRKTMARSQDVSRAVSTAVSTLAVLAELPPDRLRELEMAEDGTRPAPFDPASLGLPPLPDEFRRELGLVPLPGAGRRLFHATVRVRWQDRVGASFLEYRLDTVLKGLGEP